MGVCVGLNNASVIRLKKTEALFQKNYASESEVSRKKELNKKQKERLKINAEVQVNFIFVCVS